MTSFSVLLAPYVRESTAVADCSFINVLFPSIKRLVFSNLLFNTVIKAEAKLMPSTDHIFECLFLNENIIISIQISLKFIPKGPINNSPALIQTMARRRPGGKPLSEPMLVRLLAHVCVTRPRRINSKFNKFVDHNFMTYSNKPTIHYHHHISHEP